MAALAGGHGLVVPLCSALAMMISRVLRWLRRDPPRPLGRWAVTGDWETRAMLATMDSCCCTAAHSKAYNKQLPVAAPKHGVRVGEDARGDVLVMRMRILVHAPGA